MQGESQLAIHHVVEVLFFISSSTTLLLYETARYRQFPTSTKHPQTAFVSFLCSTRPNSTDTTSLILSVVLIVVIVVSRVALVTFLNLTTVE